ncbi:MAG: hypothetical protein QNJ60_21530 [Xenococcaceae cyanobacterium MO_188.B19]|nr:hypothetical protein [Xenococcaceae cyanobacterium MO_188.B19]
MFKFKTLPSSIWAIDGEWIPDSNLGKRLYNLPQEMSEEEVFQEMWNAAGADDDSPRPFLKLTLSRIVSFCAVSRNVDGEGKVSVELRTFPCFLDDDEGKIIGDFLEEIGEERPLLVGFKSSNSDLKILLQRGVINGVTAPGFCHRPSKPWEGLDYFARESGHIDLSDVLGAWGKAMPSLHEFALACGIPSKINGTGDDVAQMWLDGKYQDIINYNQCDALTTYLVFLRCCYFAGIFDEFQYSVEQELVEELLLDNSDEFHLKEFLTQWQSFRN